MFNKFHSEWLSKPRIVLGVMTGNSLDAVDLALVKVYDETSIETLNTFTLPLTQEYNDLINGIFSDKYSGKSIAIAHNLYSEIIAESIEKFIDEEQINRSSIEAVAIHGQTIFHDPAPQNYVGHKFGYTLQIGNGSHLAKKIELPVISDFRSGDVAYGGQGAPLVPIFDNKIFREKSKNVICLNIGGISNISFLPKNSVDVIAFDTGPGNVLIDIAMQKYFQKSYDKDGQIANQGDTNSELFEKLTSHEFIKKSPPKSTGKEDFGELFFNSLELKNIKPEDIISTVSKYTAWSITENIKTFAQESSILYPSGGGAKNSFIMEKLSDYLPAAKIRSTMEKGIDAQYKEAICFAYLGWRTFGGLDSNLPKVTGASRSTILGSVSLP